MSFIPHGKHLIAGEWVAGRATFRSQPSTGAPHDFFVGETSHVETACAAAEDAFWIYGYSSRGERAAFLNAIADEIEARAAAITQIGCEETGLPVARLEGERGRTVWQLRLFASHILSGDHLDHRLDAAQPDRKPLPRPEIRLMQRPVGPVAVFGASNFPLAFSTAGGDTAAALAAGCPVIVKGHSAHPGTGEIVAEAIRAAIETTGMPGGVFSLIQGGNRQMAQALVQHPLIRAVGFTGSLAAGRTLFNLCAARPEPIPFFGELGSVNPVFVLPHALAAGPEAIGEGWAASLSQAAGQFCTNPGIVVVADGPGADRFVAAAQAALEKTGPQVMLTDGIAEAYRQGRARLSAHPAVQAIVETDSAGRTAAPGLYETGALAFLSDDALGEEVFGPLGLIVRVGAPDEMVDIAMKLDGQLTVTLHLEKADAGLAQRLMPIVERKAGRILANGFPTGVEVCDAMVHGGPYPASTNFGATSVGTMSIRRFLRPVSYQNFPAELLSETLPE